MVTHPDASESTYYYDEFGNALEEPATQEAASEFYANFASVEAVQATADLNLQDHASVLDSQLAEQLDNNYTGEWFEAGQVKIGITLEGYERSVKQDLDNLGLADNTAVVTESASWEQLTNAQASLDSALKSLEESAKVATGIDVSQNAVELQEANDLTGAEKSEVSAAASAAGVPTKIVEEPVSSVSGVPTEAQCEHSVCDKPLRGGVHIEWHKEGAPPYESKAGGCTAGYIVRSVSNAIPYVLTAGHCLAGAPELGYGWESALPSDRETESGHTYYAYGDRFIGHGHSYMFGEKHEGPAGTTAKGDAGMIPIESEFWDTQIAPVITDYGVNEAYNLIGDTDTPESRQQYLVVCTSGAPYIKPAELPPLDNPLYPFEGKYPTPTVRCGAPLQTHLNRRYVNEKKEFEAEPHGLVEFYVCDEKVTTGIIPGASGSPVFKAHFAYGIVSGASNGNGCYAFYQPITSALSELHVELVTAGSP